MQLTGRASLRDGIQSMNSRAKNMYHLGAKPVPRATFADAVVEYFFYFYIARIVSKGQTKNAELSQ